MLFKNYKTNLVFNGNYIKIGNEPRIWNNDSTGQSFPVNDCIISNNEICQSCEKGVINYYHFDIDKASLSVEDWTPKEINQGFIISGACTKCGFCCGENQDS